MAKSGHFCIQLNTPTPRRRCLRLGELEPKFYEFSSPTRRSNAPPRRTASPRHNITSPRRVLSFVNSNNFPLD